MVTKLNLGMVPAFSHFILKPSHNWSIMAEVNFGLVSKVIKGIQMALTNCYIQKAPANWLMELTTYWDWKLLPNGASDQTVKWVKKVSAANSDMVVPTISHFLMLTAKWSTVAGLNLGLLVPTFKQCLNPTLTWRMAATINWSMDVATSTQTGSELKKTKSTRAGMKTKQTKRARVPMVPSPNPCLYQTTPKCGMVA